MADESTLKWDEVEINEEVSELDFKKSETLNTQSPVGLFLCEVENLSLFEKNVGKGNDSYTCVAIKFNFKVNEVLEIEQPIFSDDGKPVMRNGEPLMKTKPISGAAKIEADGKYGGMILKDDVCMFNKKEKDTMRNRRFFVARKIGILDEGSNNLTSDMWKKTPRMKVLIRTEWNSWEDSITKEQKKNVKVKWDGYESVSTLGKTNAQKQEEIDLAGV